MAKGKSANPADAHRKAMRAKEVKKNKEKRKEVREVVTLKKDTGGLEAEIRRLTEAEKSGSLDAPSKARLLELQSEVTRIKKTKEDYVTLHPEHRHLVYKEKERAAASGEEKGESSTAGRGGMFDGKGRLRDPKRSVYYDAVLNPFGAPPPGMPYRERPLGPGEGLPEPTSDSDEDEEDSDEEIIMPEGPPPPPTNEDDSDSDDSIVMPEGPPPPEARLGGGLGGGGVAGNIHPSRQNVFRPPGPPGFFPNRPPPQNFPSNQQFPPGFPPNQFYPQQFPPGFPPQFPHGHPQGQPGFRPMPPANFFPPSSSSNVPFRPHRQGPSTVQDPLSDVPHTSFQAHALAKRVEAALPPKPAGEVEVPASAVISAAPQIRDFRKEAAAFKPRGVKRKKEKEEEGLKIDAAPVEGGEGGSESKRANVGVVNSAPEAEAPKVAPVVKAVYNPAALGFGGGGGLLGKLGAVLGPSAVVEKKEEKPKKGDDYKAFLAGLDNLK